jgi:hypothetical protein
MGLEKELVDANEACELADVGQDALADPRTF